MSKTRSKPDNKELYLQLFEIQYQLSYLGERALQRAVQDRMELVYNNMDAQEHKELAIDMQNLHS